MERAAQVFNQQGYAGSSFDDLMRETGLKKGGIYNHFRSKDDLALKAFDYSVDAVWQRIEAEVKGKHNAIERLQGMLEGYRQVIEDPPITGGCPILNTAIESDDTHLGLRERARTAMTNWRAWITRWVERGIAAGEIRPHIEGERLATLLISMVEGGVMMSKLYDDPTYIRQTVAYLSSYLEREVRA